MNSTLPSCLNDVSGSHAGGVGVLASLAGLAGLALFFATMWSTSSRLVHSERASRTARAAIWVLVPSFKYPNNVGALLRSAAILGGTVHVRGAGEDGRLSVRQRRDVWRYASQVGKDRLHESITDEVLGALQVLYVLEPKEFWDAQGIPCTPVYDLPARDKTGIYVGNEEHGIDMEFLKEAMTLCRVVAAFIPQNPEVKSDRRSNVSLNMQVSVAITMSALRTNERARAAGRGR
jgi:tRNA(Leu) C34 or U34 (ribose-2'-O)-methylase TrmL